MSHVEVKDLIGKVQTDVTEMRAAFESQLAEIKGQIPDEKTASELLQKTEAFTKWNEAIDASVKRMDELEVSMKRKKIIEGATDIPEEQKAAYEAFFGAAGFLRKGENKMGDAELKALSTVSDPDGGYLVPVAVSNKISKIIFETSPIRQYANVETISTKALEGVFDGDEAEVYWTGETQSRPESDTPQIGKWEIPVHEMAAKPKATQNMLDDSAWNVENWLNGKVSAKMAREEAKRFVVGDGIAKPRGLLSYGHGTVRGTIERVASGAATAITADLPILLEGALKAEYRNGAIYFMARNTETQVRLMKDGMGNYLWQPSYQQGSPRTLNGYAYALFEDMPAIGAGNLAMGFGNIREAYTIVDRQGVRILRDPYSSKPYVEFYTTRRVGGDVVNFEAVKLGQIATTAS